MSIYKTPPLPFSSSPMSFFFSCCHSHANGNPLQHRLDTRLRGCDKLESALQRVVILRVLRGFVVKDYSTPFHPME